MHLQKVINYLYFNYTDKSKAFNFVNQVILVEQIIAYQIIFIGQNVCVI